MLSEIIFISWPIIFIVIFSIVNSIEEKKYCLEHNLNSLEELGFWKSRSYRSHKIGPKSMLISLVLLIIIVIITVPVSSISDFLYIIWTVFVLFFLNKIYYKIAAIEKIQKLKTEFNQSKKEENNHSSKKIILGRNIVNKKKYIFYAKYLGGFGLHKFYAQKVGVGILYFLFSSTPISWVLAWFEISKISKKIEDEDGNIEL